MVVAEVTTACCGELTNRSEAPSRYKTSSLNASHGSDARHATQDSAGTTHPSLAFEGYYAKHDASAAINMNAACYVQDQNSAEVSGYNTTGATKMSATCCVQDFNSTLTSNQNATICYSNPCETTSAPVESCSSASYNTEDSNNGLEGLRQQYKHDQTCYDIQLGLGDCGPGHLELNVSSPNSISGHPESLACVATAECPISEPNFSSSSGLLATVAFATDTLAANGVSSDSSGYCSPEKHRSPFVTSGGGDVTIQKSFSDTCPERPSTDGGVTDGKPPSYANGCVPPSYCLPYYNSYAGEVSAMPPAPYPDYRQSVAQNLCSTGDYVDPAWSEAVSGGYYLGEEGYLRYWSPSPLYPSSAVNLMQGVSGITLYTADYGGLASGGDAVYSQQQGDPTYYPGHQHKAPMAGSFSSYVAPYPIGNQPANCQLTQCPTASFAQNPSTDDVNYGSTAPMPPNGYCDNTQYLQRSLQQQYQENQSSLRTRASQQQSSFIERNRSCNPSVLYSARKQFPPNITYHQGNRSTNNGAVLEKKTFTPIQRRYSIPNHRIYHHNITHTVPTNPSPSKNSMNSGSDRGRSSDGPVTKMDGGGPMNPLSSDVRLSLSSNTASAPDAPTIDGPMVAAKPRSGSTSATTSRSPSASPQKRFSVDVEATSSSLPPSNPSTSPSPQHRRRSVTQEGFLYGDGGPLNLSVPKRLMKQYNCYQRLDLPPTCLGKPHLLSTQTNSTRSVEATWRAHMALLFRNLHEPWLISRAPDRFDSGDSWASYRDLAKVRFYCQVAARRRETGVRVRDWRSQLAAAGFRVACRRWIPGLCRGHISSRPLPAPVMSALEYIYKSEPSGFVPFLCCSYEEALSQTCSDGWTSMYGIVIFYYRRNLTATTPYKSRLPLATTNSTKDLSSRSKSSAGPRIMPQRPQQPKSVGLGANSTTEGWGQVLYQVAGQKCGRCRPLSYEMPLWYAEEAQKVITNLYYEVARQLYGLCTPTPIRTRRLGQPHTHHNAGLCQGCQHGLCKVVDSGAGYNSTPFLEATTAVRSLASPSPAFGSGSTCAGQPLNMQYPAATGGYQGNDHTDGYVCNGGLYPSGIVRQQAEQKGVAVANMQHQNILPVDTRIRRLTNSLSAGIVKSDVNSFVAGLRRNENVRATRDREPSQGHQKMVYDQEGFLLSTPQQAHVNRNGAVNIAMANSKFVKGELRRRGSVPFQDQRYRGAEGQAKEQTHALRRRSLDGYLSQGESRIQSYTQINTTGHESAHDEHSIMRPLQYEHLVRNSLSCGRERGAMSIFSTDYVSEDHGSHVAKKICDQDQCSLVEENNHHSDAWSKADKETRYQFSGCVEGNSSHQPSLPFSSTYPTIQNVYKLPNLPVYGGYTKYDSSFNSSGMYFYAGSMMNSESLLPLGMDSSSLDSPMSLYGSLPGGSSLPASYLTSDSSSSPPCDFPSHSTPHSDYCFRTANIGYHPYNYPPPYPANHHPQHYAAYHLPPLSGSITETPPAQQGKTDHVIAGAPSNATAAL